MEVDMSPKAIESRLKLVGELTRACLLVRRNSLKKTEKEQERIANQSSESNKKSHR